MRSAKRSSGVSRSFSEMAKKTKPGSRAPLLVAVCSLALVGGLAAYIVNSPGRTIPNRGSSDQSASSQAKDVKVYTPRYDSKGDLKLDSKTARPASADDPMVFAVNNYLDKLPMVKKEARAKKCTV